ncbi:MAG: type I restriction enzyme S subunit [Alloalcanivorax venustensis]|jgi:type I restriction enzyme S subunit
MVPDGWNMSSLGEVMDFKNGLNFKKEDAGEAIKIVGVKDFKGFTELMDFQSLDMIKVADKIKDDELLKSGDLLFVRSNGNKDLIGRCLYFPSVEEKLSFSGFTIRGRVSSEMAITEYVAAFARSQVMRQQIAKSGGGTNISNLSQSILNKVQFPKPPINEQKEIAKILSTWDEAIATTEQLLANSEQQKKALMQQLLTGKKRLPGFQGEWEEVALGRLFSERKETGIAGLSLLSVTSGQGVIKRDDVGRKDTSSADKSRYLRVCPGDIAYNTMRMWQGVSALSGLEGIVSPAYTVLKPESTVDSRFAAHLFKLPRMVHRFYRHSQGLVSDTWNLKYKQFARIKVLVPGVKEQMAIADVLCKEDETISCLEEQLGLLAGEKKALMQQLLTGKRRVKVDEAERATA